MAPRNAASTLQALTGLFSTKSWVTQQILLQPGVIRGKPENARVRAFGARSNYSAQAHIDTFDVHVECKCRPASVNPGLSDTPLSDALALQSERKELERILESVARG